MPGKNRPQLDVSPNTFHRRLADKTEQELAYRGDRGDHGDRGGDVAAWQRTLRRKVGQLLGMDRFPKKRPPLRVRSIWTRPHELGTIEKIAFTAEHGADVPAYVCVPADARPPYRWMICLQGHTTGMHNSIGVAFDDETKPIAVEGDHDFALQCLRHGLAALCIEQRAFGQRSANPPNPACHEPALHALMLGRTLIGERVFDVDRALDYLATRRDVDWKTVGVMGSSGGGTIAMFSAALLPRLRFAMPACYFCTFEHSIMSIWHCMCNYVPGLLNVAEMSDVMGLFAPRPLVIVAGEKDDIFPVGAVRSSFRKLKRIYRAAGAGSRCHLLIGPEGHRFYANLAWPAALAELESLKFKA